MALSAGLGFTDDELADLGLLDRAEGPPATLADAYIRRSRKQDDMATLRGHVRDVVRWARSEGVTIRHVWFEQRSASKQHVTRPEFHSALSAVLDGKSRTLAVWKTDRLDRRGMGEVGRVLDEFDRRNARLVSIVEGLDSSKGGRIVFAILSERARDEARDIGTRVTIGHDEHRKQGRQGTGVPPYGLMSIGGGKIGPHPEESATARAIAEIILDGKSTTAAAHTANGAGYRTRRGNMWTPAAVAALVQSPRFAGMVGQRERVQDDYGNPTGRWRGYGEPLYGPDGRPVMCGTGIVTPAEWFRMRALIRGRRREGFERRGKPEAKHLLTGILRCARCGGSMSHSGRLYRCETRKKAGPSACQGLASLADRADDAVTHAWIAHVSALEPGDPVLHVIAERWALFSDPSAGEQAARAREELSAAEARLRDLEDDYYVRGRLSAARFEELRAAVQATVDTIKAAVREVEPSSSYGVLLDGAELAEAWEAEKDIGRRRTLLAAAVNRVTLKPAKRRGDTSPVRDRLEFDWVTAEP